MENKKTYLDKFLALRPEQRRLVHFSLCEHALEKWDSYAKPQNIIEYRETVTGTLQVVDKQVPMDAISSARQGFDPLNVAKRYQEPITALQDDDLTLPDNVCFAYYAIYNLFQKYAVNQTIDDWLIVNQALSAENNIEAGERLLKSAIQEARQIH